MFQKLHLQMTLFCTFVTSGIFLALTFLCLLFAEKSIQKSGQGSFLAQLTPVLTHLQEQDCLSHQWLSRIQENGQLKLFLYDNAKPISYQNYHFSKREMILAQEALDTASAKYGMDPFSLNPRRTVLHTEYGFISSAGQKYHASAGIIPKKNGQLSYLLLFSLEKQETQLTHLRFAVCLANLASAFLLFLFFRYFTGKMMLPIENSQKRQKLFIASAAHELRAPLAIFRSGLEALGKTESPAKQAHFIEMMSEENTRMQNLISQMLLLANADSKHLPIEPGCCQPEELLLNIYEKYGPLAAKKQISLSIQLPEELLPDCYCDREKIIQVFSILMDNALSYTSPKGKVCLSLSFKKPSFLFCFSDTGCGIPEKEKALVFERFYRSSEAHADKEHFGLGLCIAREIVLAHAGSIWVESQTGQGSRFYVELPLK